MDANSARARRFDLVATDYERQRAELYSTAENVELETRLTAIENDPLALIGDVAQALRQEFESGDNLIRQRMRELEAKVERLCALIK